MTDKTVDKSKAKGVTCALGTSLVEKEGTYI
jgi:hypothetical protein